MESSDDGFHSNSDVTEDEENIRKSLQSRDRDLQLICESLCLPISSFGKALGAKLDKYSKNLLEKGISEVSRAHIVECHARQVLKQDDLKMVESTLNHLDANAIHLLATSKDMNTLNKKAIKTIQNENEKNKKQLERTQPYFARPGRDDPYGIEVDERVDLMRRAMSAIKKLHEMKQTQLKPASEEGIQDKIENRTKELEALNSRLAEMNF